MSYTCKAQVLDALNEIEDTLGTLRFMAQHATGMDEDTACFVREMNRIVGMRLSQIGDARDYVEGLDA